ncbi:MAG: hypothetical protein AAGG08_21570, partial [Actinomycetota bacterium]
VELDAGAGQWRFGWSDRHAGRVGTFDDQAMSELDALLEHADVVSVDLFDTLLLRPTTDPDGLFDLAASRLGHERQMSPPRAASIVQHRRDAERQLRITGDHPGDVTLDEIVAAAVAQGVTPDDAAALQRVETELEHDLAVPRTWLIERLHRLRIERPAVRIVLMTDTTQPTAVIESLLTRIGAAELFDERYVSNDRRARKDLGTMWELVEAAESPTALVHIGDNPTSDLQTASDRGHHWFQTPAPGELPELGGVDLRRIDDDRRRATEFLVGHGLAVAASTHRPGPHPVDPEGFGAAVVGPMMLAFARWTLEVAASERLDAVLFGGRDCHLVHQVAARLTPFVEDAPPLAYLAISRRAALHARLAAPGGVAAAVDASPWHGTLAGLLDARLALGPDDVAALAAVVDLDRSVVLPDDRDAVLDLVGDLVMVDAADGLRLRVAELVGDARRIGLVDLGYSGTILRAVRPLLDQHVVGLFGATTAAVDGLDDVHTCFSTDARIGHGDL